MRYYIEKWNSNSRCWERDESLMRQASVGYFNSEGDAVVFILNRGSCVVERNENDGRIDIWAGGRKKELGAPNNRITTDDYMPRRPNVDEIRRTAVFHSMTARSVHSPVAHAATEAAHPRLAYLDEGWQSQR